LVIGFSFVPIFDFIAIDLVLLSGYKIT
jgi:hypothetical protein